MRCSCSWGRGDVLCPQCQREGEELAADGDDGGGGPRPPASGAMHPDYPEFAASAARMLDDDLCAAIGVADADPDTFKLDAQQLRVFLAGLRRGSEGRFEPPTSGS